MADYSVVYDICNNCHSESDTTTSPDHRARGASASFLASG